MHPSEFILIQKRPQFENPLCAQVDPEIFFPDEEDDSANFVANSFTYTDAKKVCDMCEYRVECASWAIKNEPYGFWGGLSPAQRRTIRKKLNIRLQNPY